MSTVLDLFVKYLKSYDWFTFEWFTLDHGTVVFLARKKTPVWSKAGTINSLEALKETDVKKASVQELINIVALKRFFRNYFSDFKREYLKSSDSLLRSQQDAQGKKLISKSHHKAVDIGLVELGILIPDPVLDIVDTVDTLYNQMFDSNLYNEFDFAASQFPLSFLV